MTTEEIRQARTSDIHNYWLIEIAAQVSELVTETKCVAALLGHIESELKLLRAAQEGWGCLHARKR